VTSLLVDVQSIVKQNRG